MTATDLSTAASDPFYRCLNLLLREHGFDDFVEGPCAGSTPRRCPPLATGRLPTQSGLSRTSEARAEFAPAVLHGGWDDVMRKLSEIANDHDRSVLDRSDPIEAHLGQSIA